jgi:hypothetical protein
MIFEMDGKEMYDVRLQIPFRILLNGASGCGKSTYLYNMLLNSGVLYSEKHAYTVLYYSTWQPLYTKMQEKKLVDEFRQEVPSLEYISQIAAQYKDRGGIQVLVDDLIDSLNDEIGHLFKVGSHHEKISIVYISQTLFPNSDVFRTMRSNANYIVLFKSPSNVRQVHTFMNQFNPENAKELIKVYKKATLKANSYLLLDLNQSTPEHLRVRKNIFPFEGYPIVYVPSDINI